MQTNTSPFIIAMIFPF